ncbi:extensin-like [Mustela erminea]|uniref:extensin-like n=1 Tax=Mustela erminea TaxID=36723 RepID=UPI001386ED8B|nr:extensin-like [Mustela erminea]
MCPESGQQLASLEVNGLKIRNESIFISKIQGLDFAVLLTPISRQVRDTHSPRKRNQCHPWRPPPSASRGHGIAPAKARHPGSPRQGSGWRILRADPGARPSNHLLPSPSPLLPRKGRRPGREIGGGRAGPGDAERVGVSAPVSRAPAALAPQRLPAPRQPRCDSTQAAHPLRLGGLPGGRGKSRPPPPIQAPSTESPPYAIRTAGLPPGVAEAEHPGKEDPTDACSPRDTTTPKNNPSRWNLFPQHMICKIRFGQLRLLCSC